MKKIILTIVLFSILPYIANSKVKKLKQGVWQAQLKINEGQILPFNFRYNKIDRSVIIFNADEKITLNTLQTDGKNFTLSFPIFNSAIIGTINNRKFLQGFWYNYSKGPDYKIPFNAIYGNSNRFNYKLSNSSDFIGKWEVTFDYTKEKEKAIGLFNYSKETIHGTFLTETGDYRYLEGVSFNDSLKLSCFDGTHAFLFNAKLVNDTLWGEFFSGTHYYTNWYAVKNETFELRDPEKLTYLVDTNQLIFNARDLNDNDYLFPNSETKNKVVIIQILGTWCPNCLDETNYLKDLYDKYQSSIEIIGVGFEVGKTNQDKIEKLVNYKNVLNIKYPLVLGGNACKPCAEEVFPMLNGIMSFPTLIILDKKHKVRKIHTGFSGPSTGIYYTDFVKHTNEFINQLTKEN